MGVCLPVTRGLSLPPTRDDDLHIAFCATGKGPRTLSPPGRDLGERLARSHMTHKLKQNKGALLEPGMGKGGYRKVMCSTQA